MSNARQPVAICYHPAMAAHHMTEGQLKFIQETAAADLATWKQYGLLKTIKCYSVADADVCASWRARHGSVMQITDKLLRASYGRRVNGRSIQRDHCDRYDEPPSPISATVSTPLPYSRLPSTRGGECKNMQPLKRHRWRKSIRTLVAPT